MMKIFVIFGFALAFAIIGGNVSASQEQDIKIEIVTLEKMTEILKQHPNAVELSKEIKTEESNQVDGESQVAAAPQVVVEYTLGRRVAGDRLSATGSDSFNFATPQNVKYTISYPTSGVGDIVSYVSIVVAQSYNNGRAYVINGGIGLRYISIVVEAQSTYVFNPRTSIYGY